MARRKRPPKIQLPGDVEAHVELIVEPRRYKRSVGGLFTDGVASVIAKRVLRLRRQVAGDNRQLGPRFQDAKAGLTQRQVLLICVDDQHVERGVVEHGPPAAQVLRLGATRLSFASIQSLAIGAAGRR